MEFYFNIFLKIKRDEGGLLRYNLSTYGFSFGLLSPCQRFFKKYIEDVFFQLNFDNDE
jgi:hypothetical protein